MPATPAWPPKSAPRLFVAEPLAAGAAVRIEGNPAHYLARVMRAAPGWRPGTRVVAARADGTRLHGWVGPIQPGGIEGVPVMISESAALAVGERLRVFRP